MIRQTLNQNEINNMVEAIEAVNDFGWEEVESDDGHRELYEEEYSDGQPSEYDEWQDYMGGDDWDHGQYDETF